MQSKKIHLLGQGSRAEELYELLRSAILTGELAPNERLVEEAIANSASVSRTPVREAIHKLGMDGLVKTSNRGVVVADFSAEELSELCSVRETLEGLSARLAGSGRSDLDLATLHGLIEETRDATERGDVPELVELNHRFHETVWYASRNHFLASQLLLLRSLIERLQTTTLAKPERQLEALAEHEAIVAAIAKREEDEAEGITRRHFRSAMAIRLTAARRDVARLRNRPAQPSP